MGIVALLDRNDVRGHIRGGADVRAHVEVNADVSLMTRIGAA
jgi:hypothetical protein